MKVYHRVRRGFTLIELMVVVAIIALLVGITIPALTRVRKAAQGAATSSQLAAIATAIQQYYGDFKAYPGPLPNNQLGIKYGQTLPAGAPSRPYIVNAAGGNAQLKYTDYNGTSNVYQQFSYVTGPENLVLGILGGVDVITPVGLSTQFNFDIRRLFPNAASTAAAPLGAMSLDPNSPKVFPSYLQVRPTDLSHPNFAVNNGQFTDDAGRFANDTIIPEFVDQYPSALPILYMRANVGGTAIASVAGRDKANGTQLTDSNNQPVTAQYDLAQIIQYTQPGQGQASAIGTTTNKAGYDHHGLQGLGAANLSDTIQSGFTNGGANALAYLKDPNNPGLANTPQIGPPSSVGTPRQKDAFILISAGPDRLYGTADDIIYPGSLNP